MEIEKAREYILSKLENELKPNLYYHSINHTLDVCEAALRIGKMEKVKQEDLLLIETAALFHDSGIMKVYKGHELASIDLIRQVLPDFDYSKKHLEKIEKMIIATQLPQKPPDKLSEILCDADLDYLGRDDFYINALCLYREWYELGIRMTLKEWYELQITFLSNHTYFTDSALSLRQEKKYFHLNQIKELLNKEID